jgi:hypothetical protein
VIHTPSSTTAAARCYLPGATMTESSPTKTESARKPAKKKAARVVPPPSSGEGVADWRTWGGVGAVLVVGVVAWKLLGSSYKGDVETICNGETASGFTLEHDTSKVTAYIRQHLDTPEGNELFSTMSDAKLAEKAKHLQSESSKVGVRSCPLVEAYEKLSAEGEYRADVQHLCSNSGFPHLGEVDDAARLQRLEDWIDQAARSPRTKELAEPLRQGSPADRAKLLRETAAKVNVFSCDLAKTLEGPILPARGTGQPVVRPYAEPQIIGTMKPEDLAKALIQVTPAMNECYKKGLEKKADLEGKLAIKMKIDPAGKVTGIAPAEEAVPDKDTTACLVQAMRGMEFPKNPGPLVSVFIPLELTTTALPTPGAAGAPRASASGTPPLPSGVPSSLARP